MAMNLGQRASADAGAAPPVVVTTLPVYDVERELLEVGAVMDELDPETRRMLGGAPPDEEAFLQGIIADMEGQSLPVAPGQCQVVLETWEEVPAGAAVPSAPSGLPRAQPRQVPRAQPRTERRLAAQPAPRPPVAPTRFVPLLPQPPQMALARARAAQPTPAPARAQPAQQAPRQTKPDLHFGRVGLHAHALKMLAQRESGHEGAPQALKAMHDAYKAAEPNKALVAGQLLLMRELMRVFAQKHPAGYRREFGAPPATKAAVAKALLNFTPKQWSRTFHTGLARKELQARANRDICLRCVGEAMANLHKVLDEKNLVDVGSSVHPAAAMYALFRHVVMERKDKGQALGPTVDATIRSVMAD